MRRQQLWIWESKQSKRDYIGGALCYGRKSNAALVLLPPLSFHSTYPDVIESLKAYSGNWSGTTRAGHRSVRRPFLRTALVQAEVPVKRVTSLCNDYTMI